MNNTTLIALFGLLPSRDLIMWYDNLKAALEKRGLSQADLARKLDVTRTTVSNWCSGQRTPTLANMQAIAKALDMTMGEILGHDVIFAENKMERDLIQTLREMDEETREKFLSFVIALAHQKES